MKNLKVLRAESFKENQKRFFIKRDQENDSSSHTKIIWALLKLWVPSNIAYKKIQEKKSGQAHKHVEQNPNINMKKEEIQEEWYEEKTTVWNVNEISDVTIKENVIFRGINFGHPIFQKNTIVLDNYLSSQESPTKLSSIEIENVDVQKIGELAVKNKLIINPIQKTIEVITKVKVKKLAI